MRLGIFLLLCSVFVSCSPSEVGQELSPLEQPARILALVGGQLIDGTGAPPLEDSLILVEGATIVRVGRQGEFEVPAEAEVIDAAGKSIIPGLVDGHIHLRNFYQPVALYWGVTTVADLGDPPAWIFAQKRAVETGLVLGPHILTVGSKIDGPDRLEGPENWKESFLSGNERTTLRFVTDESSLEAAILEQKHLGADAIKLNRHISDALMRRAVEISHREGLPIFAHFSSATSGRSTEEVLDFGFDMHLHTWGLEKATVSKETRARIEKGEIEHPQSLMDPATFPALAKKMVQRNIFLNAGLAQHWAKFSQHRAAFEQENTRFLKGPVGALLPELFRHTHVEFYRPYQGEHFEEGHKALEKLGAFVKTFADQGGKLVSGPDTTSWRPMGIGLHVDLEMLQEGGVTPMHALQSATLWPMEAWRKEKEAGTVEVGKRADLVVLNRDPLEDIAATRDIQMVVKNGQIVDREALADWKDPLPIPVPEPVAIPGRKPPSLPNTLIEIPLIEGVSPSFLPIKAELPSEVVILGKNFSPDSRVVFNETFLPTKFYNSERLGVTIDTSLLKAPGTYLLLVIESGSGGAASNMWYLSVGP